MHEEIEGAGSAHVAQSGSFRKMVTKEREPVRMSLIELAPFLLRARMEKEPE